MFACGDDTETEVHCDQKKKLHSDVGRLFDLRIRERMERLFAFCVEINKHIFNPSSRYRWFFFFFFARLLCSRCHAVNLALLLGRTEAAMAATGTE